MFTMRTYATAAGTAAITLALAGCGAAAATGHASRPATFSAAASAAGCTATTISPDAPDERDPLAYRSGECVLWHSGANVEVATFDSPGQQRAWESFTRSCCVLVTSGSGWAVGKS